MHKCSYCMYNSSVFASVWPGGPAASSLATSCVNVGSHSLSVMQLGVSMHCNVTNTVVRTYFVRLGVVMNRFASDGFTNTRCMYRRFKLCIFIPQRAIESVLASVVQQSLCYYLHLIDFSFIAMSEFAFRRSFSLLGDVLWYIWP